jgi:hypothetical protein
MCRAELLKHRLEGLLMDQYSVVPRKKRTYGAKSFVSFPPKLGAELQQVFLARRARSMSMNERMLSRPGDLEWGPDAPASETPSLLTTRPAVDNLTPETVPASRRLWSLRPVSSMDNSGHAATGNPLFDWKESPFNCPSRQDSIQDPRPSANFNPIISWNKQMDPVESQAGARFTRSNKDAEVLSRIKAACSLALIAGLLCSTLVA